MTTNELCDALRKIERAADNKARNQLIAELIKQLTEYKHK